MINIIIGILFILGSIISVSISINQTPENLKGFYGKFYWFISALTLVAGLYILILGIVELAVL